MSAKSFHSPPPPPPTSRKLLSNKFGIDDQNIWSSVYLLPAGVTLDTKIRMFQYKILNNILYVNQRLYHMNLVESPFCSLCKREIESISHLFRKCEFSTRLWAETQRWRSPAIALPHLIFHLLQFHIDFLPHLIYCPQCYNLSEFSSSCLR